MSSRDQERSHRIRRVIQSLHLSYGDSLHIVPRRVMVPQCILRVRDRAALLSNDPRVAEAGLVQLNGLELCLRTATFQVPRERVRRQRRARLGSVAGPLSTRPSRSKNVQASARRRIVDERRSQVDVGEFPAEIGAAYF